MRKGFANSTSSRWNTDAKRGDLILAFKTYKSEVYLNPSVCALHLHISARTKPSSAQEWCIFCSCCEILEQIAGASSLATVSAYIIKNIWTVSGPKSFLQHLCNFCSPSSKPQAIYISLAPKHWSVYLAIVGPRGQSYHNSINVNIVKQASCRTFFAA